MLRIWVVAIRFEAVRKMHLGSGILRELEETTHVCKKGACALRGSNKPEVFFFFFLRLFDARDLAGPDVHKAWTSI